MVTTRAIVLFIPALLLSLSVHEFMHAWMATKLGDPTPVKEGRLTLSPLSHIDPIGTILFPGIAVFSALVLHAPLMFFGWAKPVRFDPSKFTRKLTAWQATAIAALVGPVSNLVLAVLSALVIRLMIETNHFSEMVLTFCDVMIQLNVILFLFNLVPLPPLDGGRLIPPRFAEVHDFLSRYSFIIFILLFFIRIGGTQPIGWRILSPAMEFVHMNVVKMTGAY